MSIVVFKKTTNKVIFPIIIQGESTYVVKIVYYIGLLHNLCIEVYWSYSKKEVLTKYFTSREECSQIFHEICSMEYISKEFLIENLGFKKLEELV